MNGIYPSAQIGSSVGPDRDTVNAGQLRLERPSLAARGLPA